MLDRLSEWLELSSSLELAEKLGVAPSTLSGWKTRGTIPIKYFLEFAEREPINLNWLLLGVGPKNRLSDNAPEGTQPQPEGLAAELLKQGKTTERHLRLGQISSMAQLGSLSGIWKTLSLIPPQNQGSITRLQLYRALANEITDEQLFAQLLYLKQSGQISETSPGCYYQNNTSRISANIDFDFNAHTIEGIRVLVEEVNPALKASKAKLLTIRGSVDPDEGQALLEEIATVVKNTTRKTMQASGEGAFIEMVMGIAVKNTSTVP